MQFRSKKKLGLMLQSFPSIRLVSGYEFYKEILNLKYCHLKFSFKDCDRLRNFLKVKRKPIVFPEKDKFVSGKSFSGSNITMKGETKFFCSYSSCFDFNLSFMLCII